MFTNKKQKYQSHSDSDSNVSKIIEESSDNNDIKSKLPSINENEEELTS